MNIEDLQKACSVLGLDYKQFAESSEIEKSVAANSVNYKALYEKQKELNEKLLGNIGEISKSFDTQLEKFQTNVSKEMGTQIKELEKSLDSLKGDMDTMKKAPMHSAKSAKSVTVIEKSVGGGQKSDIKTLNINTSF